MRDAIPPALEVSPRQAELGNLAQGREYEAQFELRNQTPETVVIRRVELSCACTSHIIDRTILSPGEQTKLHLTWATRSARGAASTHADVYFTVGESPLERLTCVVKGHVVPNIRVDPESLVFEWGVLSRQRVVLSPQNIDRFRVLNAGGSHPSLKTTRLPRDESAEDEVLEVDFDPAQLQTTPRRLEVIVVTDDPVVPHLRLPVIVRRPEERKP